jgi:2-oxoglutarate ferredoxin oxidoreductase subunit alpha
MVANRWPKTLQEAIVYFSDVERCFAYAVKLRWPDGIVVCPRCGVAKNSFIKTRRLWFCYGCKRQFTIKVKTIFEDSPLGLDKWMVAFWMLANCKNGISSHELGRTLGITQTSAWFMLQRIREVMGGRGFGKTNKMGGSGSEVEADETFVGGKMKNMHKSRRLRIAQLGEQYKGKEKLLEPNIKALHMGRDYAASYLPSIGLRVKRANGVGSKIFLEGNSAAALGCVYAGATVAAWYPITPSSSLAEAFSRHCRKYRHDADTGKARYAVIQAEDELASIGIVIGASWNGARAFTCTSGPGISLMQEFIGLAYFAEIPAVIFDVQRGGPSTGMPTRTQQSDVLSCAYASHGDTKHVLLLPEDPKESFDFAALAFDLAERLQTPTFVLMDLDIGMNERLCEPLAWDEARRYDRGKVMTAADLEAGKEFGRYLDVDGDGIAYRTYPGAHPTRGAYFTRGTTKDRFARYSEAGPDYVDNMQRLLRKFETAKELVPKPVLRPARQPARLGVIYFGSTSPAMHEALDTLERDGVQLDALRVRAFPFQDEVYDFIADHEQVFVVEQNRDAQLRMLLVNEGTVDPSRLISVLHYDGTPITARFIIGEIAEKVAVLKVTPLRRIAQ